MSHYEVKKTVGGDANRSRIIIRTESLMERGPWRVSPRATSAATGMVFALLLASPPTDIPTYNDEFKNQVKQSNNFFS